MEEDIKILEELLNSKISFTLNPTDYGCTAIRNLINKNKELEKMVELMASFIEVAELDEDIAKTYCKNEACTEINEFTCKKCIIDYFKKKASEDE